MGIRIVNRTRRVVETRTVETDYEQEQLHLRFTIGPVTEQTTAPQSATVAAVAAVRAEVDEALAYAMGWDHSRGAVDVSVQLQDHQQVVLSVTAEDAAGNVVTDVGNTLTWSVDDATLLTLTDNGDGTQTAAAVGPLGVATVTVSDAEAGAADGTAGATFLGSVSFEIVNGPVSQVIVNAGAPTEIAAVAPTA